MTLDPNRLLSHRLTSRKVAPFLRHATHADLHKWREAWNESAKRTPRDDSELKKAMAGRPRVGGFPYLAETLRRAGVTRNIWFLPACQSLYLTNDGPVVTLAPPLVSNIADVPRFNREALIAALRTDQAGTSTFPEFLAATWRAGVVRYDVDFAARTCTYYGCNGEEYLENYPAIEVKS